MYKETWKVQSGYIEVEQGDDLILRFRLKVRGSRFQRAFKVSADQWESVRKQLGQPHEIDTEKVYGG